MFGLGAQEIALLALVAVIPLVLAIWVVRNFAGGRKNEM
jgi:hypothetical protein